MSPAKFLPTLVVDRRSGSLPVAVWLLAHPETTRFSPAHTHLVGNGCVYDCAKTRADFDLRDDGNLDDREYVAPPMTMTAFLGLSVICAVVFGAIYYPTANTLARGVASPYPRRRGSHTVSDIVRDEPRQFLWNHKHTLRVPAGHRVGNLA
jgi:hypothetical protein